MPRAAPTPYSPAAAAHHAGACRGADRAGRRDSGAGRGADPAVIAAPAPASPRGPRWSGAAAMAPAVAGAKSLLGQ